jgi:hypothetical protein
MTPYQFWVDLHAFPAQPLARSRLELNGQWFETLIVPPGSAGVPLGVSFEEACAELKQLEQMLIEPDGSFVWSSPRREEGRWQVDGVLYDRAGKLIYVELKGSCPPARFDEFLGIVGWPQTPIMFQLVREAAFLDEANFRRHASALRFD